jgi:hypothetical protein
MLPSFVLSTRVFGSGLGDELGRVNHRRGKVPSELYDPTERTVTQIYGNGSALLLPTLEASAVTDIDREGGDIAINDQRQAEGVAVEG